jgi:hypothetical protein
MMCVITLMIGGVELPVDNASEGRVNQMIAEARRAGGALCIQVRVQIDDVNVSVATPGCGRAGSGGRQANAKEQRILDAWARRGLSSGELSPGELRAFLNELRRLL